MLKKIAIVVACSLLSGCWFHADKGGVGGGVGKAKGSPSANVG